MLAVLFTLMFLTAFVAWDASDFDHHKN